MGFTRLENLLRLVAVLAFVSLTGFVFIAQNAQWHINDDIGLLYFLSGALDGDPTWQVPFIAPIASIVLRAAHSIFGLPGYPLVLLAVLLVAIYLLIDAASRHSKKVDCFSLFYTILVAITSFTAYFITLYNLTFTLIAGLSSVAVSGSLALRTFGNSPMKARHLMLHVFILAFSISLRSNASVLALLIMIPACTQRANSRSIRVVLLAWTTTYIANQSLSQLYSTDLKRWVEFDGVRGLLQGSRGLSRANPELLQHVKWTTNDFGLFRGFLHFDKDRFGIIQMRTLVEKLGENWVSRLQAIRFSDFQTASDALREVLAFSLMTGFAYFLWSGTNVARRKEYLFRLLLSSIIPLSLAAVLLTVRFPFRVEFILVFASVIGALVLPLTSFALPTTPTKQPPSGRSRAVRIRAKLVFQRTGAILLMIVAVASLMNFHSSYFDEYVSFESPESSRNQYRRAVLDLLATRGIDEVTLLMPGTEAHENRSPFDSTPLIPDRGIRFGWPIGAPAWERRNQALQIDLRQALVSAVNVNGEPIELSILSRAYPDLLSAYVLEESGVLPAFEKGPCAELQIETPCLWYRSRALGSIDKGD